MKRKANVIFISHPMQLRAFSVEKEVLENLGFLMFEFKVPRGRRVKFDVAPRHLKYLSRDVRRAVFRKLGLMEIGQTSRLECVR